MIKHLLVAGAIAVSMLSAGVESAVTFSFGGGNKNLSSIVLNKAGLTLAVSAFKNQDVTGLDTAGFIDRAAFGWGIRDNPNGGRVDVDQTNTEALVLQFSRNVVLDSLSFNPSVANPLAATVSLLNGGDQLIGNFSTNVDGASFTGNSAGKIDDRFVLLGSSDGRGFRFSQVTATAVPVPAGLGLMALGLVALFRLKCAHA